MLRHAFLSGAACLLLSGTGCGSPEQVAALARCRGELADARKLVASQKATESEVIALVRTHASILLDRGDTSGAKALLARWAARSSNPGLREDLASIEAKVQQQALCETPAKVDFADLELEGRKYDSRCITTKSRYFFVLERHSLSRDSAGGSLYLEGMERVDIGLRKRLLGVNGSRASVSVTGIFKAAPDGYGDDIGEIQVHRVRL